MRTQLGSFAMLPVLVVGCFSFTLVASLFAAEPPRLAPDTPAQKRPAPPAGVRVSVESDKPEYFLGENILLHFHVRNAGAQPFELDSSDESAAESAPVRDPRYWVMATNAAGKSVPPREMYPRRGLELAAGTFRLEPGESF